MEVTGREGEGTIRNGLAATGRTGAERVGSGEERQQRRGEEQGGLGRTAEAVLEEIGEDWPGGKGPQRQRWKGLG